MGENYYHDVTFAEVGLGNEVESSARYWLKSSLKSAQGNFTISTNVSVLAAGARGKLS